MIRELQSTLKASGMEWPDLRNHTPCMAHVIRLALGAIMSSHRVQGHTKSSETHERNQQFGENESIVIGKSQRFRQESNATINKVSAMRPALAKIIEKVRISRNVESPETNLHIVENEISMDYADTSSTKRVHWLTKCQCMHRSTTYYGCDESLELVNGVAWASLPIVRIHLRVAPESKICWLPATLHNTRLMDHLLAGHGHFKAGPILNLLNVEET